MRADIVIDLLLFTLSFDPHHNLRQNNIYSLIFREETMPQLRCDGIHLVSILERLKQGDSKFKASLNFKARPCLQTFPYRRIQRAKDIHRPAW